MNRETLIDNFKRDQYIYDTDHIVERYNQDEELQPAERAIKRLLLPQLHQINMLDIGIGAGRTTLHFAHRVKSYTGIDYSQSMVQAAKNKKNWPKNTQLFQDDARYLSKIPDNTFELTLFSYNGIDYVNHSDRLSALKNMIRVTKPGGHLCFSTHNLIGLETIFNKPSIFSLYHRKAIRQYINTCKLIKNNKPNIKELIKTNDHLILNDGSEGFKLLTYFIKPSKQIEQLQQTGSISNIRTFLCSNGKETTQPDKSNATQEPWMYFLCDINK